MKKIATLALTLVLVLGATGIGFAKWSETLKIEGVVETGEVDVQLSQCTNDPSPAGVDPELDDVLAGSLDPAECGTWEYSPETAMSTWSGERYDKNVAAIDCELIESDEYKTDPNDDGPNVIEVTVRNGYPCYYGNLAFDIENIGTVPVKVESIKLLEVSKGEDIYQLGEDAIDLVPCQTWYVRFDDVPEIETEVDDPDDWEFSLHLSSLQLGTQIDPNPGDDERANTVYGDICVHVEQSAEELQTYDFQVAIVCSQWNEVPIPTPTP